MQYLCEHSQPQTACCAAEGSPDTREACFPPPQQPDQDEAREGLLPHDQHRAALPDPHRREQPHNVQPRASWWSWGAASDGTSS